MSQISARLGLPYLMPAQAQKHITHNEALQQLDVLAQLVVEAVAATVPPVTPFAGVIYALGADPIGVWSGEGGALAYWTGTAWLFVAPQEGWQAWNKETGSAYVFQAGVWTPSEPMLQNLDGVGIGTSSDAVNLLSVAADATLLSHAGGGHQCKLNKAAAGDTASLLYQSGFAGHAEMGLTGDNDFHIKVSPDGSTFTEALVFDAATGHVTGAAVQSSDTDTTPGRLALAEHTYGPGNLLGTVSQTAGVPTGSVIETGDNNNGTYVRYADGTQQCFQSRSLFVSGPATWSYPASFANPPKVFGVAQNTTRSLSHANEQAPTNSQAKISLRTTTNGRSNGIIDLMAIGRWF